MNRLVLAVILAIGIGLSGCVGLPSIKGSVDNKDGCPTAIIKVTDNRGNLVE
jgi:hypothetical protein